MDESAVKAMVDAVTKPTIFNFKPDGTEHGVILIPEGQKVEDLAKYLPPPARIQQRIDAGSVESFCAYVDRFKVDSTVIFANEPSADYVGVIDYHMPCNATDGRGHRSHEVRYLCPHSDQWKSWNAGNGKPMTQEAFAQFIETNLKDISKPSGAELLEICLFLQIHKSAKFESGMKLASGQHQFAYVEEIKGTTKSGKLEIPEQFTIAVPVFIDGVLFKVDARFRYRVSNEGVLSVSYDLIRPLDTYRSAVKTVTGEIAKRLPKVPLYQGVQRS